MANAIVSVPPPKNEPVLSYAPGTAERRALRAELARLSGETLEIAPRIGGARVQTGKLARATMPHRHAHVLATWHQAGDAEVRRAIDAALAAHADWSRMAWEDRAAIFLRAADLLAGPWRMRLNAATMLGQSKTSFQAEIDAACELIDFWRFNAHYMEQLYREQPQSRARRVEPARAPPARGLRVRGDAVQLHVDRRQPADRAGADGQHGRLEAGVDGRVLRARHHGAARGGRSAAGRDQHRAGPRRGRGRSGPRVAASGRHSLHRLHRGLPGHVGDGRRATSRSYRAYPRIVGETGGKDFVFAHASADVDALAVALVRGAFEYQGQKCSAASRAYVPASLWPGDAGAPARRRSRRSGWAT